MFIKKIHISNFRIFDETGVDIVFNSGINAIVGENNNGKSAIIDAIRIATTVLHYRKDIYVKKSDFHVGLDGSVAEAFQIDVFLMDVPANLIKIWNPQNVQEGEFHIRFSSSLNRNGTEKISYVVWGGSQEENKLDADTMSAINVHYLPALRNVDSDLRPSKDGLLYRLLENASKNTSGEDSLVDVLKRANDELADTAPLKEANKVLNENVSAIEQEYLAQNIKIGLIEPDFKSIAGSLRLWVRKKWVLVKAGSQEYSLVQGYPDCQKWSQTRNADLLVNVYAMMNDSAFSSQDKNAILGLIKNDFEVFQNSLGYNNLLYMSSLLGTSNQAPDTDDDEVLLNLLLVEEPEAHLHPQLLRLLHEYFDKQCKINKNIQVIYTSHSPILTSQIDVDCINILYERNESSAVWSLRNANLDSKKKGYLKRYLDVTKSQLFFAKGLIFVEGISEALLIPVIAKYMGKDLKKFAIEVVDIESTGFENFTGLVDDVEFSSFIKSSVITDDDRCTDKNDAATYIGKDEKLDSVQTVQNVLNRINTGIPCARVNALKTNLVSTNVQVFTAVKTLEYELALGNGLGNGNVDFLLSAIAEVHPNAIVDLRTLISQLNTVHEKAAAIWLFVNCHSKSKGQLAQALADLIEQDRANSFVVPDYIKNAIEHVVPR